jgi:hypothetical protein
MRLHEKTLKVRIRSVRAPVWCNGSSFTKNGQAERPPYNVGILVADLRGIVGQALRLPSHLLRHDGRLYKEGRDRRLAPGSCRASTTVNGSKPQLLQFCDNRIFCVISQILSAKKC